MKNLSFTLITIFFLASCKKNDKLIKEGDTYYVSIEEKQGDKSKKVVKFTISTNIIDSLKVPESSVIDMCKETAIYADWNAKYKPTYKLPDTAMLLYMADDKEFIGSISGTCENAYGTPDEISTYVKFGQDFKMIKDSSGIPEIMSF